jgi:hypothetical protein
VIPKLEEGKWWRLIEIGGNGQNGIAMDSIKVVMESRFGGIKRKFAKIFARLSI